MGLRYITHPTQSSVETEAAGHGTSTCPTNVSDLKDSTRGSKEGRQIDILFSFTQITWTRTWMDKPALCQKFWIPSMRIWARSGPPPCIHPLNLFSGFPKNLNTRILLKVLCDYLLLRTWIMRLASCPRPQLSPLSTHPMGTHLSLLQRTLNI